MAWTPWDTGGPERRIEPALLAVDLGLRTGIASFGENGRLSGYRSQNYGNATRLKRAVLAVIGGHRIVVAEGARQLGRIWERSAVRLGARFELVAAEDWRPALLSERQRRTGEIAKLEADGLARRIIEWSDLPRPTALRHDAAEAIAMGLWAAVRYELLSELPSFVEAR